MEAKTAKLVTCEFSRKWSGPKGLIYYFNLEWDNGDKGEMSTNRIKEKGNSVIQTKFVVGMEQQYTVENKVNKQTGNTYLFFDKYKEPYNPNSGYSQTRQQDPGRQMRIVKSVALKAAIKIKFITKDQTELFELADIVANWINEYGGNDEGKNISAQTAINTMIIMLENVSDEKKLNYKDHQKFFKHCKLFADYITTES